MITPCPEKGKSNPEPVTVKIWWQILVTVTNVEMTYLLWLNCYDCKNVSNWLRNVLFWLYKSNSTYQETIIIPQK